MTHNPFINAGAAALYIAGVVSVIFNLVDRPETEASILMPIAMLSLLVLSALVMSYVFLFNPVQMYLDGKKKEAVSLFVQSLGVFAGFTAALFLTLVFVFL